MALGKRRRERQLMMVAARNLRTVMRAIIGIGGPMSPRGFHSLTRTALTQFGRPMSALDLLVAARVRSTTNGSRAPGGRPARSQRLGKPPGPRPANP